MSEGLLVTFLSQPPAPEAAALSQQPGLRQNDRTSDPTPANQQPIGQMATEKGITDIVFQCPQPQSLILSTLDAKDLFSK